MNFLRQNFYQAGWQVLSVVQGMVSGTLKGSVRYDHDLRRNLPRPRGLWRNHVDNLAL